MKQRVITTQIPASINKIERSRCVLGLKRPFAKTRAGSTMADPALATCGREGEGNEKAKKRRATALAQGA